MALVLAHAFAKGAPHGAYTQPCTLRDRNVQNEVAVSGKYPEREINPAPWWGIAADMERRWSVFVGDGLIIDCSWSLLVAANSDEKIDEVADLLHITWQDRW
jgi:hypothetical protein